MRTPTYVLLSCFAIISVLFSSCKEEESTDPGISNNYVNEWIYGNMSFFYLWEDKIPPKGNLNFSQSPEKFFESVCYRYDKYLRPDGDRFSWIQDNYQDLIASLSGVSSDEIGFEYQLYLMEKGSPYLIGEILYVKRNTPAEAAGLRRGQFFKKVNGTVLTDKNYELLFSLKGNYKIIPLEPVYKGDKTDFVETNEIQLSTVSKYAENPVYLDSIYNIENSKIGYLVYNFFAGDEGDGSMKYDKQLADVFNRFKHNGVTDLVLDLRYNSGGSVLSSVYLASMLTKAFDTKNIFITKKYNKHLTALFEEILIKEKEDNFNYYFTDKILNPKNMVVASLPNIGQELQHLYILTGARTASASELIVNGLDPYMGEFITLLGDTTVGKNVGSFTIEEGNDIYEQNNTNNKWAMQPITFLSTNAFGESGSMAGLAPDIYNQDFIFPKKPLGDRGETLLSKAIANITGFSELKASSQEQSINMKPLASSLDRKAWRNKAYIPAGSLPLFKSQKQ